MVASHARGSVSFKLGKVSLHIKDHMAWKVERIPPLIPGKQTTICVGKEDRPCPSGSRL